MRPILFIAFLLIACGIVRADTLTLTWDPPVQRIDGSPLGADGLKEFRLYDQRKRIQVIPAPTIEAKVYTLPGKAYVWEVTAVDKQGLESSYSNPVQWQPTPVPTIQWPPVSPNQLRVK